MRYNKWGDPIYSLFKLKHTNSRQNVHDTLYNKVILYILIEVNVLKEICLLIF